jgi:glycosyltransferase involved in cell wall biosynthesis
MKVLVATDDRIAPAMAGSALRAWELGRALAAEHDVIVAGAPGSCAPAADGPGVVESPPWRWAEAIVAAPWILQPAALASGVRLVVDGITPLLAELAAMPPSWRVLRRRRTAACRLPLAAARADAVLMAGEAQRRWWSRQLARAGRPDAPLLEVPFGIGPSPPDEVEPVPGVPEGWSVVLWWGGVWPWLDLETLLAARAVLGAEPVSVVVPVASRPGSSSSQLTAADLRSQAARFGLRPPQVVGLTHWAAYEVRHRMLNRAAVLAVLHHPGEEAELAFRTRAMDGLWAGVPLLVSEGGEVARLVAERGWGRTAPVHDPEAVAHAVHELMAVAGDVVARLRADRQQWRWERVTEPLCRYLAEPVGAAAAYASWAWAARRAVWALIGGDRACSG